ncbi:hypothetical protein ACI780_06890 [Geodermatophilus sp. SYSU D00814]
MPLDLTAVAGAFAMQLRLVAVAQKLIAPVLGRRLTAARSVDLATRAFPVVRFVDGAVSMTLTPGQLGTLTPAGRPPSLAEQLEAGGRAFVDGLSAALRPLQGEDGAAAIPRFLTALDRSLAEVEASVARFDTAGPRTFDPDSRTAADLFGLLALTTRALAEASRAGGQVQQLTGRVRAAMGIFDVPAADTPAAAPEPAATPAAALSLTDTLNTVAFGVLGLTVLVGGLPAVLDVLRQGLEIRGRQLALDELGGLERSVLELRRDAVEAVSTGLAAHAQDGVALAAGAHEVIGANVHLTLRVWRALGTEVAVRVRDFVLQVVEYFREVLGVLRAVPRMLGILVDFDLAQLLRPTLGRAAFALGVLPSLSLGDLLDASGRGVNRLKQFELNTWIDAGELFLDSLTRRVPLSGFSGRVRYARRQFPRARRLVRELFTGGGSGAALPEFPEAAALRFRSDFPDLRNVLAGPAAGGRLVEVLDRLEQGLHDGVTGAVTASARGLSELASTADAAAADAVHRRAVGSGLRRVARQSGVLADLLFAPVVAEQRGLAARPEDPLALAHESFLAGSGFDLVQQVLEGYVGEVAAHWRAQLAQGTELTTPVTPTSPRILRRRAALARVAVPRLTLRVTPGQELDEELAALLAGQFEDAVRAAHRRGRRRLAELAEQDGP